MRRDRELERRLREEPLPGEAEAEELAWEVVRAAYAERTPVRPTYRARRLGLAFAGGAAVLAIALSPAGAKVGELVEEVIGEEDARPALRSLPAAGELLVESEQGVWAVREDGSKRLLGDYDEASWSPNGLFVAVGDGRELLAVEPGGEVRWSIPTPGPVHDPRWGGTDTDTRIAYRSGDDLRVVPGDGDASDDRLVALDVAPVAPIWLPAPRDAKLGESPTAHVLAYLDRARNVRVVDADSGRSIPNRTVDQPLLHDLKSPSALSPDGTLSARIERRGERFTLSVAGNGARSVLYAGRGRISDPTWSPDGRWLLVAWREADQWLFIRTDRPGRIVAFDRISEQFDPGDAGDTGRFPRVAGWVLPDRSAP